MTSGDLAEKLYKDKKALAIIKVLKVAYPEYLWVYAILYLSKRECGHYSPVISMYERINSLLGDGIVERHDMNIGELRNNFDNLVNRGILNRGELNEPYEPRDTYRLTNEGRRVSVLDEKKIKDSGQLALKPLPA